MLMLLFQVGEDRYALDSSFIIEVLPRVPLQTLHQVPEFVAGVLNYRGAIIPIFDLCQWIRGTSSISSLSTRLIMFQHPLLDASIPYVGLIAEGITETLNINPSDLINSGIQNNQGKYLAGFIQRNQEIIQCIDIEELIKLTQFNPSLEIIQTSSNPLQSEQVRGDYLDQ